MADTDILLSVDLNTVDAERTAEQLQKEIQGIFNSRQGQQSSALTSLEIQMKKLYNQASEVRQRMQELAATDTPTEGYAKLSDMLERYKVQLDDLRQKSSEFEESGGNTQSQKFQQWTIQIEKLEDGITNIEAKMQAMRDNGTAFIYGKETEEYKRMQQELDGINDKLKQQIIKHREISEKRVPTITSRVKELGKATNQVNKATTGIFKKFGRIALMLLGFRGLYSIISKIRSAITEGFKNLQESGVGRLKKQMNDLTNASTTLKNSLAGAFEPIVTTIIPYIQKLVEWLTIAIDKLAQFIAAMHGQTTYIKAIKQVGDAGAKASKQLAKFDELNVLNSQKNGAAGMFEEAKVADEMIDRIAQLKQKIQEIKKWLDEWVFYPVRDFINWFTQPIRDNIDKIKLAIANFGSFIQHRIDWIKGKIQEMLMKWKGIYDEYIKPTIDKIVEYVSYFFGKLLDFWNKHYEDIDWVVQQIEGMYDEYIQPIVDRVMKIAGLVFKIVGKIFTILRPYLDDLFAYLDLLWDRYFPYIKMILLFTRIGLAMVSDVIQRCLDTTIKFLEWIDAGFPKAQEYVTAFRDAFTGAMDAMIEKIQPVIDAIGQLVAGLQTIAEFFTGASGAAIWNSLDRLANNNGKNLLTTYSNSASKNGLNADKVMDTVWQSANVIDMLAGSNIGTTIDLLKRKRGHASGGVIPPYASEHLVKVGDNKHETEVISPLSTMQEAMINALQAVGINGGQPINIYLGTEKIYSEIRKMEKRNAVMGG